MKKSLIILQEEVADCGVCSLLSIIRYYGGNVPLEQLRVSSLTTKHGVTAFNLIECARTYGLYGKGLKVDNFDNVKTPFIAHLNIKQSLTHFVVIYKVTDSYLYIMDPANGYKKIRIEEFNKEFTEFIIEFIPTKRIPYIKEEKILAKSINSLIHSKKTCLSLIIILTLFHIGISIIASTYTFFLNNIKYYIILAFIILNAIALSLKYLAEDKMERLYQNLSKNIICDFFKTIFSLPLNYIQLKGNGELIKRVEDMEVISRITITSKINIFINLMIISVILPIICIFLNKLFIIILLFSIVNVLVNMRYSVKLKIIIDENILENSNYSSIFINYFSNLTSINHSNSLDYFLNKMSDVRKSYNESDYKLKHVINKYNLITNITVVIFELIINVILYTSVQDNIIGLEVMFMLNILINTLINSIMEIIKMIPNLYYKNRISNKIDEMLNLKLDDKEEKNVYQVGDATFRNVNYSYSYKKLFLRRLNIRIKKGDKLMIKGRNGCGKSTLLKLLTQECVEYEGSITIGDIELSTIDNYSLRSNISYLSQDEDIFIGTIRENILLGINEDIEDIIKICKLDQIFSNKINGLDTFLYESGDELSGGEKQLIILARHLVRYKDILIIDEGTSELNSKLEDEIIKNIITYYKDKTLIFVSHRNKEKLFNRVIELY